MWCNVIPVMLIANTMTLHKSAWINHYGPLFSNRVPGEVCPVQDHHFVRFDDSRSAVIQKVRWSQYSQIHPAVVTDKGNQVKQNLLFFFNTVKWSSSLLLSCSLGVKKKSEAEAVWQKFYQ